MDYQSSIRLGIALESEKDVGGRLQSLINTLQKEKINLDINIKDSNIAKQLETLTTMANTFKTSLGSNISLGNVNEIINQATASMERLNSEVLKTRTVLSKDGLSGTRYSEVANGIGIVTKQMEVLNSKTKEWETVENGKTTTIINNEKIKKTLEDIAVAQEKLNALESRGNVNSNEVDRLKGILGNASENISGKNDIYNSGDIAGYLNEVKQLETEEKNNIQLANEIQDAWDKAYKQRISSEQNTVQQIEANEKKAYENEIIRLGEQAIAEQKAEQDLVNEMANGREKAEIKSQKVDRSQELAQAKAINQALEEQKQILAKQEEAYRQIDVLKNNGIISSEDIANLEKMTREADSLQKINGVLKSIMGTAMMKESSLVSLSKQIDDAQLKLDKMRQVFGNKLPTGFADSIQSSLNKLKEDLKTTDELGFNGLRTRLNNVNSEMKVTTNETQQLVNSLKETNNGGFFSGISNFLGKVGIFYGVQQVVQEISQQFKNASEYTLGLDKNISDIMIITGRTRDDVVNITNSFKELGGQLHTTNKDMLSSASEMMRAGYSDNDSKKMIEQAVIGAKISGQTTEDVSQQLITMKNAFNMSADSMSHVIDIFSKLDNTSATSFREIAEAVSRTAYSAQEAKVPLDTLASYITVVSEKTRREASTIGDQFRTMFSRFQNIKLGILIFAHLS